MTRSVTKLVILALALASLASAQTTPSRQAQHGFSNQPAQMDAIGPVAYVQAPPTNYRYPDGLTYVYNAEWRLFTAGTASLRLEAAGDQQKVVAGADSAGVVSLLYAVHDRFESYFDRRTFCSQRIYKHTEEGFHKKDTNIRFDYPSRKAVLDERNLKNNKTKNAQEDIPGCVVDVLSGIYYVGSLPLQMGANYTFPVNDGGKTMQVRATVEAREQVKTDAGTFNTIRVRTDEVSGVMKKRGSVWIWYTDDPSRMPVQMRARAFWGTLNFKLTRVERK
ncbi:MAG TPA: DUF3108 domain-containing protein [Terriglobales bacterium]|nr:DUF3108 domain-containing protein [Terriglobales bacterium]